MRRYDETPGLCGPLGQLAPHKGGQAHKDALAEAAETELEVSVASACEALRGEGACRR